MPTSSKPNGDSPIPATAHLDLESIIGSLEPIPDASLDFDREIAEATAEEIRRKQSNRQAATDSVQAQLNAT